MATSPDKVPFFLATERRPLTKTERELVRALVERVAPAFIEQLDGLNVVGRCGCAQCPTVFFQSHGEGSKDRVIASFVGRDESEGLTGVVLWQDAGRLAQLEFYSLDGHEPWTYPKLDSLQPI